MMDTRGASDGEVMSETTVNKCPKSFSIESLISRKSPPAEHPPGYPPDNVSPALAPSLNLPPNFPVAAAAAIYNPWIHSYLAQQHPPPGAKYPTLFELPSDVSKDKLSQMFGVGDPRIFFGADPAGRDKLLAQYIANNAREKKFSDLFLAPGDYYGGGAFFMSHNFSGDLRFSGANIDGRLGAGCNDGPEGGDTNLAADDGLRSNGRGWDQRGDDDGHDELIEEDLDSDCSSELSLTMSPEGANRVQGKMMVDIVM